MTDGFVLGGMSKRTMQKVYIQAQADSSKNRGDETSRNITTASTNESDAVSVNSKSSPYLAGSENSALPSTKTGRKGSSVNSGAAQSFVFNENMAKIRQAELIILVEERKFGVLSKDPDGRLMPLLQAMTRQAAHELRKDNRRPITEPALTASYAPHAASSDIGLAPPSWTPGTEGAQAAVTSEHTSAAPGGRQMHPALMSSASETHMDATDTDGDAPRDSLKKSSAYNGLYSSEVDAGLKPNMRGQGKSGGLLAPLQTKGADTRRRRPLKTTLTSDMEFNRTRQIRTLGEKIDEINRLRESILEEKRKLDEQYENKSMEISKSTLKPLPMDSNSPGGGADYQRKLKVVKSAVSNHTYGTDPPPSYLDYLDKSPPAGTPKTSLRKTGSARFQTEEGSSSKGRAASPDLGGLQGSPQLSRQGSMKRGGSSSQLSRTASRDSGDDEEGLGGTTPGPPSGTPSGLSSKRAVSPAPSPALSKQSSRKRLTSGDRTPSGKFDRDTPSPSQKLRKRNRSNSITRTQFADEVTVFEQGSPADQLLVEEARLLSLQAQEKTEELKKLHVEKIHSAQKRNHFLQDESRIGAIKETERFQKNRELSRDIERKRRLLTAQEGLRVGPAPEDPANMYDYYAIKVQSTIRGFIARCWIRWFRAISIKAATKLQSVMRGWFGRMRVRRIRKYYNAARAIQKNFRGWFTRVSNNFAISL